MQWVLQTFKFLYQCKETRSRLPFPLATTAFPQSAGNRGYVLQLCNAIRLQADTMPPTEFLRTYLNSHEQWRNFVGILREATLEQQTPGLGFEVSNLIDAACEQTSCSSNVLLGAVPVREFYHAINFASRRQNHRSMQPILFNLHTFRVLGC